MRTPEPNPLVSRDDLQRAFQQLEAPLLSVWPDDSTGPNLGGHRAWYGQAATRLEPVARYLWGLVPFTAGGGKSRGWTHVLDAIAHGTDPDHPQYWGPAGTNDQRSVEMAAFGLALRLVPDQIWTPLSRQQKDRLATWLVGMVDKGLVSSNWQFFRLMVTMGLRHVDRDPANADGQDAKAIELIDSYYLGNGWYEDGKNGQRDYYIPMAFHFYSLLLARLATAGPVTQRLAEWTSRARAFAKNFVHWFAADGAALPFGRSLTYRFAQGAFWGGCAVAGVEGMKPGEWRGLLLRHFRWWWKQPMLEADGTLSLGYSYPNHNILEPYNACGSPYWAFKAFAPLMLKATDPFWTDPEVALETRHAPDVQQEPGFLIDRDPDTGHLIALSAGQWHPGWPLRHRDAKYAKLAYSTFFGPSVGANHEWLAGSGIDNTIAIQLSRTARSDGMPWQCRGVTTDRVITADNVVSRWSTVPGLSVRTWQVPLGAWQVRIHHVQTEHDIQFAEGGFALKDPSVNNSSKGALCAKGEDDGISGIVDLAGAREAILSDVEPNSSLYHSRVKTPILQTSLSKGGHTLVTGVLGAAPGSKGSWSTRPDVTITAGNATVRSPDGKRTVSIDLNA